MSTLSRDKRILELVVKTYDYQSELREKLDSKLNNFVGITGTVSTLSVGVALFVFDKIKPENPLYFWLIITFLPFFGFFISALVIGLIGYKPSNVSIYPTDAQKIISDYSVLPTELHIIRIAAASFAEAANANIKKNRSKSNIIQAMFCLLVIGAIVFVVFAIIMIFALSAVTVAQIIS
jgi:hypothetical protein